MESTVQETEKNFNGFPVSEGIVLARVCYLASTRSDAVPRYDVATEDIPAEKQRFQAALVVASEELAGFVEQVTKRIGAAQAKIFGAQKMMVEDPVAQEKINELIESEEVNVETAIVKVLDQYESELAALDNDYLRERASDIGEVRRRLLDILRQEEEEAITTRWGAFLEDGEYMIVVAEELAPSDTVTMDTGRVVGFITERGGAASHAAILARAMGIPAVTGIQNVHGSLPHGQEVLLNGSTGQVILRPTQQTIQLYPTARRTPVGQVRVVDPVDNYRVMGNISLVSELVGLQTMRAEGIGLYRTEFEFLAAGRKLTEDEQYERYSAVVTGMQGHPVYIRLLDFGGDKPAPFLNIPHEENPCVGYRGARLLLGEPELFVTQARAIARASAHGPIHVMYPMIVHLQQYLKLKKIFTQGIADLPEADLIHGVMFEVPSACIQADEILEVAEFGSIGTNDLIQHLFAIDRNNDRVAPEYNPDHPILWTLIGDMAKAAKRHYRPLTICGEIAGQPQYIVRILELGIDSVSVSPRFIGVSRTTAKRLQNTG